MALHTMSLSINVRSSLLCSGKVQQRGVLVYFYQSLPVYLWFVSLH